MSKLIEDWDAFFTSVGVERKSNPFGMRNIDKASDSQIEECAKELSVAFPVDYRTFSLQLGPGTLGRCRIYCPTTNIGLIDPRIHTHRLREKFLQKDHVIAHSFDLQELIAFAQDVSENLWFGWRASLVKAGDFSIFVFDEQSRAPPPRKVALTFSEFIDVCCFGNKLAKMGIKRFTEKVIEQDEEKWSDSEEEDEAALEAKAAALVAEESEKKANKFFRPFPGGFASH